MSQLPLSESDIRSEDPPAEALPAPSGLPIGIQLIGPYGAEAADAGLELGEGRSMAMFLKSKTMTYMLKTISDQEVKVLVELLPAYRAYMIGGDNAKGGVSSEDYSRHSSDNEQDFTRRNITCNTSTRALNCAAKHSRLGWKRSDWSRTSPCGSRVARTFSAPKP